jgi:hypothetical protein
VGKVSQSKNHWRKRKRSEHTYRVNFDAIMGGFARMFTMLAVGLTRPDKVMLRKKLEAAAK